MIYVLIVVDAIWRVLIQVIKLLISQKIIFHKLLKMRALDADYVWLFVLCQMLYILFQEKLLIQLKEEQNRSLLSLKNTHKLINHIIKISDLFDNYSNNVNFIDIHKLFKKKERRCYIIFLSLYIYNYIINL